MAKKRITELATETTLKDGQYVAIDHTTDGTKKLNLGAELTDLKEELADLQEEIESGGSGMSTAFKQALHNILEKVAYIDDDGQTYLDALDDAMYAVTAIQLNTNSLSFDSLNSTQQLTATTTPAGGNVTWSSSNDSVATVSSDGLVTSVGYGSATITASSGSVSVTCSVLVAQATLVSISATYTQSGSVYDTASLSDLTSDLVVTATWSNSTTTTLTSSDYTLSGTLTAGTSTITVSYGGKSDTFTVTVTADPTYTESVLATYVYETDFTSSVGRLSTSDGTVNNDTDYITSSFVSIPDGTTSFTRTFSGLSYILVWYDSEQAYLGSGMHGSYSGTTTYGDGYTDGNGLVWHAVPSEAKYCRFSWKPAETWTDIRFKHNILLDESVTPVVGTVYYYTFANTGTTLGYCDDYLPCNGLAYAQARRVIRRAIRFYDGDYITVSTINRSNNIGNNVTIPSDAVYMKVENQNVWESANPSRWDYGLISFSDTTLSSW